MSNETQLKKPRVLILPCSGIGKMFGTITRWAMYDLYENVRPQQTRLLCLARLVDIDVEAQQIILNHPILTIEGCPKKCASVNTQKNGGTVVKSYVMAKFLAQHKEIKPEQNVIDPGPEGLKLAHLIAEELAKDVDEIQGDM